MSTEGFEKHRKVNESETMILREKGWEGVTSCWGCCGVVWECSHGDGDHLYPLGNTRTLPVHPFLLPGLPVPVTIGMYHLAQMNPDHPVVLESLSARIVNIFFSLRGNVYNCCLMMPQIKCSLCSDSLLTVNVFNEHIFLQNITRFSLGNFSNSW